MGSALLVQMFAFGGNWRPLGPPSAKGTLHATSGPEEDQLPPKANIWTKRAEPIYAQAGNDETEFTASDWREVRAWLVANEQQEASGKAMGDGFVMYETPLIERGAVLLDADPGISSPRHPGQQYFHKAAMVVISRPGWRGDE